MTPKTAPKPPEPKPEDYSPLVKALHTRERKLFDFDALNFIGPGEKTIGSVKIRVATKAEQHAAAIQAREYVKGKTAPGDAYDNDLYQDARVVHILHATVRDFDRPTGFSAFPTPRWMMESMSSAEIGVLLDHYNYVVGQCSPAEVELSDETFDGYVDRLAASAETDVAQIILLKCDRDWLAEFAIRASVDLVETRKLLEDALAQREALQAENDAFRETIAARAQ